VARDLVGFPLLLRSIAANVRRIRLRRGLTQESLASRAEQDLSYVQRIERAATNLSVAVLYAIARALDVAPGVLLRTSTLRPSPRGRPPKKRRPKTRRRPSAAQRDA
jgi:transcriptional regulator with XRE-family HTH domain